MAASVAQTCNLALARIGAGKIDDISEDSAEAKACVARRIIGDEGGAGAP